MVRELITEDDVDAMGFGGGSAERIAVAEHFELADTTREALRWFAIGLRVAEQHETGGAAYPSLLMGRFRVRREAGMPWDGIDEEAAEWRAQRQLDEW
jgi:hypothetical protein